MLGTSHYIAPEQARGEQVDAQTDVYSFGVVLYELLTGEVPYPGDNFVTVAMKHVNEPSPSVLERRPDTPLRLASLVERCMAKSSSRPAGVDGRGRRRARGVPRRARREGRRRGDDDHEAAHAGRSPRGPGKQRRQRSRRLPCAPGSPRTAAPRGRGAAVSICAIRDDGPGAAATSARCGDSSAASVRTTPSATTGEHDDAGRHATDGDPATYWTTSTYRSQLSAFKEGVGLVRRRRQARRSRSRSPPTRRASRRRSRRAIRREGPFETVVGDQRWSPASTATWELDGDRGPLLRDLDHRSSTAARTSTR